MTVSHPPNRRVPEAVAMIANMNKHIRYMHASIGYLRDQLQGNPRLLQLGQEVHNVVSLAKNCGETLKHLSNFHEEVKFFKTHLDKVTFNGLCIFLLSLTQILFFFLLFLTKCCQR